jgi:hypothetical protein
MFIFLLYCLRDVYLLIYVFHSVYNNLIYIVACVFRSGNKIVDFKCFVENSDSLSDISLHELSPLT